MAKLGRPRIGNKKMRRVTITVDPDLYERWREYCVKNHINGSEQIREFILRSLAPRPRSLLSPHP